MATCVWIEIAPCVHGAPTDCAVRMVNMVLACSVGWKVDGVRGEDPFREGWGKARGMVVQRRQLLSTVLVELGCVPAVRSCMARAVSVVYVSDERHATTHHLRSAQRAAHRRSQETRG